jgi:hypothetical protein
MQALTLLESALALLAESDIPDRGADSAGPLVRGLLVSLSRAHVDAASEMQRSAHPGASPGDDR